MKASLIGAGVSSIRHNKFVPATAAVSRPAVHPARPGVIAGALLQAARRNAGLTRRHLARLLAITRATVKHWERGTLPLFDVDYCMLRRVAAITSTDLYELLIAQQCDLLIMRMLCGDEDYADVPPIDEKTAGGETARDLLRWAFTGRAPASRTHPARSRPPLAEADVDYITAIALELTIGALGKDLTSFGTALLQCMASDLTQRT
jgi:transcriptional regulator with XRE-family HTH domain